MLAWGHFVESEIKKAVGDETDQGKADAKAQERLARIFQKVPDSSDGKPAPGKFRDPASL